jgi:hypothetical protein
MAFDPARPCASRQQPLEGGEAADISAILDVMKKEPAPRRFLTWLFQLPQDGVVADRHSQARQQPSADPASGGMGE